MEQRETSYETIPATGTRLKAKLNEVGNSSVSSMSCFIVDGVVIIRSPKVYSPDYSVQINAEEAEMEVMNEKFGKGWHLRALAIPAYSVTIWEDRNHEQEGPSP